MKTPKPSTEVKLFFKIFGILLCGMCVTFHIEQVAYWKLLVDALLFAWIGGSIINSFPNPEGGEK